MRSRADREVRPCAVGGTIWRRRRRGTRGVTHGAPRRSAPASRPWKMRPPQLARPFSQPHRSSSRSVIGHSSGFFVRRPAGSDAKPWASACCTRRSRARIDVSHLAHGGDSTGRRPAEGKRVIVGEGRGGKDVAQTPWKPSQPAIRSQAMRVVSRRRVADFRVALSTPSTDTSALERSAPPSASRRRPDPSPFLLAVDVADCRR